MMASGHQNKRRQLIGTRTGVDVKAGKKIGILPGGFENFDDYWSASEPDDTFMGSLIDKKSSVKVNRKPLQSMSPFTSEVEATPASFVCADDNIDASTPPDACAADEASNYGSSTAARSAEKRATKDICHVGNIIGSITRVLSEPQSAQPKVKTRKRLTYSSGTSDISMLENRNSVTAQTKGTTTFKVPDPPKAAPTQTSKAHRKSQGTASESSSLSPNKGNSKPGGKATKSTEEGELKPKKSKGSKSKTSNKVSTGSKDKPQDNKLSDGASEAETEQVEQADQKRRKSKRHLDANDEAAVSPVRGGHKTQQLHGETGQHKITECSPLKARKSNAKSKETAESSVNSKVIRHKLGNQAGAVGETLEDGSEDEPESETEPLFKVVKDKINPNKVSGVETAPFGAVEKPTEERLIINEEELAEGSPEDEISDIDQEAEQHTSAGESSPLDDSSVNMLTLKSKLHKKSSTSKPAQAKTQRSNLTMQKRTEESPVRKNTPLKSDSGKTKRMAEEDPDQLDDRARITDENESLSESCIEAEVLEVMPVRTGGRRAKAMAQKNLGDNDQETTEDSEPLAPKRTRGKQPIVSKETALLEQKPTRGAKNKRQISKPQEAESPPALDSRGKKDKQQDLKSKRTKGKKESEETLKPKLTRGILKNGSKKVVGLSENVEREEDQTEDPTVELARKATAGASVYVSMMSAGTITESPQAKSAQIPQDQLSPFASMSKRSEARMEEADDGFDTDALEPLMIEESDNESELEHGEMELEESVVALGVESELPQADVQVSDKLLPPQISAPVSDSEDDYEVVTGNEFVFVKNMLPDTEQPHKLDKTKTAEKNKIKSKRKENKRSYPASKLSRANQIQKAKKKRVPVTGVDASCLPPSMNFNFEDSASDGDDNEVIESSQARNKIIKDKGNAKKKKTSRASSRKEKNQKVAQGKSKSSEDTDAHSDAESDNADTEPAKMHPKRSKPKAKGKKSKASSQQVVHHRSPRVVPKGTKSSSSEENSKPTESKKKTKGTPSEDVDTEPAKMHTKGSNSKAKGKKSKASSQQVVHHQSPRVVLKGTKSSSSEENSKPTESKRKTKGTPPEDVDTEPAKMHTKGSNSKAKGNKSKASSQQVVHHRSPRVVLKGTKSSSSEENSKAAESKTKGSSSEDDRSQVPASKNARKRKGIMPEDEVLKAPVSRKSPRKAIDHHPQRLQLSMSPEYDQLESTDAVPRDTGDSASDPEPDEPQNTSVKGTQKQPTKRASSVEPVPSSSTRTRTNSGRKASHHESPVRETEPMFSSDSDESGDGDDDISGPASVAQPLRDDGMVGDIHTPDVSVITSPSQSSSRWRQVISPEPLEPDSPLPSKRAKKGALKRKTIPEGGGSQKQVKSHSRRKSVAIMSPLPDSMQGVPKSILKRPSMSYMSPAEASGLPVHYHEVTESAAPDYEKPAAKQVKIIAPEVPPAEGIRRSRRTRVPALDWFRGERIKYDRRKSGFVVAGILHEGQDDLELEAQDRRRKRVHKLVAKKQAQRRKAIPQTPRNLSIHQDLPHETREVTSSEIPVINPVTQEEVLVDCLVTKEQCQFFNAAGEPACPEDPLILCKGIKQRAFSLGQLILRPGEEKGTQLVRTDSMIFIIKKGKMAVTIHRTTSVLETDDTFFVPQGNTYNIRNLRNDEGKLWFIQHKG